MADALPFSTVWVAIAVPLMICVKLVLARLQLFTPWLQLIESRQ